MERRGEARGREFWEQNTGTIINCVATENTDDVRKNKANSDSNDAQESQDRWLSFA